MKMQIDHIDRGLESLSIFPKEPHKKRQEFDCRRRGHGDTVDLLFSSSPSSSPSSLFGDSIGMESAVDILKDGDCRHYTPDERRGAAAIISLGGSTRDRRYSAETAERREFPPPIPSLARTENLLSRMPWVLRRHYTGDGRLILTEEKASRYEYFRAHRSNGRLTLHLVPLDVAAQSYDHDHDQKEDDHDHDHDDEEVGDEAGEADDDDDDDQIGARDGGDEDQVNCLMYRSGSRCAVSGVAVPAAIRPVHS